MTRAEDVEPGETVQPRMAKGRWEVGGVAVGGPRTVRVDTVTTGDVESLWLETETGEIWVSEFEDRLNDQLSARERHWQEEQGYRELNECKTSGVLL